MQFINLLRPNLPRHNLLRLAIGALFVTALAACSGLNTAPPNTPTPAPVFDATPTADPAANDVSAEELAAEEETPTEPEATPAAVVTFDPANDQLALRAAYDGFEQPLFVTNADDGTNRLFVVEKIGRVSLIRDGEKVLAPFLEITDRVRSSGNEQGLLGLAFPPNYVDTGHFFVNYTDANGDTVIARFTIQEDNADQADMTSEFEVMRLSQPAGNHNGGMLAFGPDGYLWIGTGDGGAANDRFGNALNPQSLLGKMLRIDVTSTPDQPYSIPADNPWVETDLNGSDVMDEIWAIGLRNPWRYSFDRATGDLWIGDVGQNQFEEINWTAADSPGGLNYGWPIMEGQDCFQNQGCDTSGLVIPPIAYQHRPHCSVTGGYVYRGSEYPALYGVYLYGDFCSGTIWTAIPHEDGSVEVYEALQTDIRLSSFGESESGELYATNLNGDAIYRIVLE